MLKLKCHGKKLQLKADGLWKSTCRERKNPEKAEAFAVEKLKWSPISNSDTIHYYYMRKDKRKVSGNFGWAGHGDSFGSAPLFSMRVGFMCNDKEAPKTASVWNQAESESRRSTLPGAGIHIKVDTYIPPWISLHSIPSDQLISTSNPQFCHRFPPSSVCISLILQCELPGYSAQHSSMQSSTLCSSVWCLPLIQAAEEKI